MAAKIPRSCTQELFHTSGTMDSKEISSLCFSSDGSWANAWTFLWITGEPSGLFIEIIYHERNPRKQRGLTQIHLDTIVWRAQGTWEVLHIHATKRNIFVEEVWEYCQPWINKPLGCWSLRRYRKWLVGLMPPPNQSTREHGDAQNGIS